VSSRIPITKELYAAVLATWLERASIQHVCDVLELPRSMVKTMADEGVPQLGLAPLREKKAPKQNSRKSSAKRKSKVHKGTEMDLAARTVIATQEAEQHIGAIKAQINELLEEARRTGAKTDVAELEQEVNGTLATLEEAKMRAELEEQRIANVEHRAIVADNTSKSATEAAAARMTLKHCMTLGAIYGHIAERTLDMIENGQLEMPKTLTPKTVASLAGSLDKLTSATERAVAMEKGRAGEPEKILGVQIGILLDACTPDELDIVAETGHLPQRLKMISGD